MIGIERNLRAAVCALMIGGAMLACGVSTSNAASSAWVTSEGGEVRLVTTGAPDADGKLKGVFQVKLKPGWKTYWRDPGSSGVAPSLEIGDLGAVEMSYPAPEWHNDGQFDWAGYTQPVDFPVTLQVATPGPLRAAAFLGLCQKICIPFQADLTLDPANGADDVFDAAMIDSAGDKIPPPATDVFGVRFQAVSGDKLILDAALPSIDGAALFLAGNAGYQFGKPVLDAGDGKPKFIVPIISQPNTPPQGRGLPYTLVTATGAVNGELPRF